MISGEHGEAVLDTIVALRMDGIVDGDQITHTLVAACISDALRKGESPREIARGLLNSLPTTRDWEQGMRDTFITAIDEYEDGQAA